MARKADDLLLEVEAVLFAAGKPLSARELAEALGPSDPRAVQRALRALEEVYRDRPSALEVRRVGERYALQLKERFVPTVHAVTPVEMAPRTVKALTLIAYHQPVLQSVLVRMIGDGAYGEVQHLRGVGLVRTEPKGATLELTTTKRFAEYFGIASSRPEEIRRFLEQKLGVPPPTTRSPAASLSGTATPDDGESATPGQPAEDAAVPGSLEEDAELPGESPTEAGTASQAPSDGA